MQHASLHRPLGGIVLVLTLLGGTPVMADVKGPGGKVIDCYCTDKQGDRVELGETICLQVDGRMFMAQCQMSLNVPMWRKVEDGCLAAENRFSPFPAELPKL